MVAPLVVSLPCLWESSKNNRSDVMILTMIPEKPAFVNNDSQISSEVIKYIFRQYRRCLEQDRSKIRLSMLTKGLLQASVKESTIDSTANYVSNMYEYDLKELLDGIENIIKKRNRRS